MTQDAHYLLADKPAGVPTHSPDGQRQGFVEYLARQTGEQLRVCHRLDKETSGVLVLARHREAARELADLFAQHQVDKRYWMITDRQPQLDDEIEISTDIDKRAGTWVSSPPSVSGNATSYFKRLRTTGAYTLWEVRPTTGKPHQIRLHAQQLGIPALGDLVHDGTAFPRVMLHAKELRFTSEHAGQIVHCAPAPPFFADMHLLADLDLSTWLADLDRRRRLFAINEESTLRLVHNDDLRCDLFGEVCWFYWYRDRAPQQPDLDRIATFAQAAGARHWKVQPMHDRGGKPQQNQHYASDALENWTAAEHGLRYHCKAAQGLSPGLFLDQRQNRLWVKHNAKDKKVLNLFCYTAGFSLCAAAAGAHQIVNVDTSKNTLDWARENFALNNLDDNQVEFWTADARYFLRGCHKRQRFFDLIICDPPSFARSTHGVFKIDNDLPDLVQQLLAILEPGGTVLLSTNYEKWNLAQLEDMVQQSANNGHVTITPTPPPDWDFELPGQEPLMKSLFLQSKS